MFIERTLSNEIFDPVGVAFCLYLCRFYKHANPPGLGTNYPSRKMPEASNVYREKAHKAHSTPQESYIP